MRGCSSSPFEPCILVFLLQTKVQILLMLPGCQGPSLTGLTHLAKLFSQHPLLCLSHIDLFSFPLPSSPCLPQSLHMLFFFCRECTPSSPINHPWPGGSCFFILQFSASPTAPNTQTLRMGPATAVREFTPSVFLYHSDTFLCASL